MAADASIRSVLLSSLGRFQTLLTLVASDRLDIHASQVPLSAWSDELGRLRVWAANVGAHQEGQSSLDYRLRDASHIRQQIFRLFDDLDYTLSEIEQLFSDSGASTKSQDLDYEDKVELQQLRATLSDVVDCLYQISLLIRKPARHDRLLRDDSDIGVAFTPWDRGHVSNKFPNADPATIDRLGSAITKRRMLLKYRERHYQKLARGLDSAIENREDEESLALSQTLATDFQDVALGISDAASATGVSQTSYAKSLEGGGDITVPAPPKESENQREFLCPYCFIVITVKDRQDWTHHVFRDLEPYVCIFPDCPKAEELYDSRREWLAHEKTDHPRIFEEAEAAGTAVCLLCKSEIASAMLEKHIAKHLQELALFSISMGDIEEDVLADPLNTSSRRSQSSEGTVHDDFEAGQQDDTSANAQEVDKEDLFMVDEPGPSKDNPPLAERRLSIDPDIRGTEKDHEDLDSRYAKRPDAKRFFVVGRVFALLWHENAGEGKPGAEPSLFEHTTVAKYGQRVYSHIRRMAVARERRGYCVCIPINTYQGQGVMKHGLSRAERQAHSIIYASDTMPYATEEERAFLVKKPIAVKMASKEQGLDKMSRINFGKPCSVEWNVKVMHVGSVVPDSMARFLGYYVNESNG